MGHLINKRIKAAKVDATLGPEVGGIAKAVQQLFAHVFVELGGGGLPAAANDAPCAAVAQAGGFYGVFAVKAAFFCGQQALYEGGAFHAVQRWGCGLFVISCGTQQSQ